MSGRFIPVKARSLNRWTKRVVVSRTRATWSGGGNASRGVTCSGCTGCSTGLDRDSIEMREVSPMSGLLPQDERAAVLSMPG
jgi:hypothetical protein